jgi:hypothetical protein
VEKKFFKQSKMTAGMKKLTSAAILDFSKNFFSTKLASYQHQMNAKRRLKKCWILSALFQNTG